MTKPDNIEKKIDEIRQYLTDHISVRKKEKGEHGEVFTHLI